MASPATAAVRLLAGEREPVRLATTANIPLKGLQAVDGVTTEVGDRVLVKDQSDGSENGIYTASAGQWYRAADARTSRTMQKGTTVTVQQGTANAGKFYGFQTFQPVIGTSAIVLAEVIGDTTALAPKASPQFTGTPTAPTAAPGTNTTQIATTGFVKAAIDVVLGGVSSAFDTLSEIATAIGLLAPKASPTFTGTPAAPTATPGTNTTQVATTAFVAAAVAAIAAPNYGTGNAALSFGAVGTYVFGYILNAGAMDGTNYAGSAIQPAGLMDSSATTTDPSDDAFYANSGPNALAKGGTALSGTWRAMGRSNATSGSVRRRTTLFMRIS